jgi:hypothetical protein
LVGTSFHGDHPSSYPNHYYIYTEGDIEVDDTHIKTKVQDKQIAAWTLLETEQVQQFNVGTKTKPAYLKVKVHLDRALAQ